MIRATKKVECSREASQRLWKFIKILSYSACHDSVPIFSLSPSCASILSPSSLLLFFSSILSSRISFSLFAADFDFPVPLLCFLRSATIGFRHVSVMILIVFVSGVSLVPGRVQETRRKIWIFFLSFRAESAD